MGLSTMHGAWRIAGAQLTLAECVLEWVILVDMVSSKAQNYVYYMFTHSFFFSVHSKNIGDL